MEKKIVAESYKGKHFVLVDEGTEDMGTDPYVDVDKVISDNATLRSHVEDCRYYGIPAYLGSNKEMNERIAKINDELDKLESLTP